MQKKKKDKRGTSFFTAMYTLTFGEYRLALLDQILRYDSHLDFF